VFLKLIKTNKIYQSLLFFNRMLRSFSRLKLKKCQWRSEVPVTL